MHNVLKSKYKEVSWRRYNGNKTFIYSPGRVNFIQMLCYIMSNKTRIIIYSENIFIYVYFEKS